MPRMARLDSPGLLHHVMVRGLDRQTVFRTPADYADFLKRIDPARERAPVEILAWALMPNHVHFLIRSGVRGLSPFMRRVLTGFARSFNIRHRRVGYVFQGRFKSLVCEEEEYLMALVRYIHLNPVAAGLVRSLAELRRYPYTGHAGLMGKPPWAWQAVDEVLGRFGMQAGRARQGYESFVQDGITEARQKPTDVLGGGFLEELRDMGRSSRRAGDQALYDQRVLGESEFVGQVWHEAERLETAQRHLKRKAIGVRGMAKRIAEAYGLEERQLFERGRQTKVSAAKAALIYAGVELLGKTLKEMAGHTNMSTPAASKARVRGSLTDGEWRKLIS